MLQDSRTFIARCGYGECKATARITCEEDKRLLYVSLIPGIYTVARYISDSLSRRDTGLRMRLKCTSVHFQRVMLPAAMRIYTLCERMGIHNAYVTASGVLKHSRNIHIIPARLSYLDIRVPNVI